MNLANKTRFNRLLKPLRTTIFAFPGCNATFLLKPQKTSLSIFPHLNDQPLSRGWSKGWSLENL